MIIGLVATAALAAGVILFAAEPSGQIFYPRCQFHELTGLECPGCGATRAVHHLLHGDLLAAVQSNLVVVLMALPTALWWGWKAAKGLPFGQGFNGRWAGGLLALLVVFFIVRNLPGPTHVWLNPPPVSTP